MDNLTYRTTSEDLEYLFEKYGKVGDVYIPKVVKLLKTIGKTISNQCFITKGSQDERKPRICFRAFLRQGKNYTMFLKNYPLLGDGKVKVFAL